MRLSIKSTQSRIRENVTYVRNDVNKYKQMAQKGDMKKVQKKQKKRVPQMKKHSRKKHAKKRWLRKHDENI